MYIVTYKVNNSQFSESFETKSEAETFKAELKQSGSYKNIKIVKV